MLIKLSWDGRMNLTKEEKAAGDACFKEHFKSFKEYMRSQGFVPVGADTFHRVNHLGVLEDVGLQKDMYGRKFFTVNLSLLPLCSPVKRYSTPCRKRLTSFWNNNHWYDYLTPQGAQTSFDQLKTHLEKYAFPWFLQMHDFNLLLPAVGYEGACYLAAKHNRKDLLLKYLKAFQQQLNDNSMTLSQAAQSNLRDLKATAIAVQRLLNEGMGDNRDAFIRLIEENTAKITKTPIKKFKF